jgi:RNA polymerase sigma-70 factor (ECF subfamily)
VKVQRESVSDDDRRLIDAYLNGDRDAYGKVDGWIRAVVRGRYGSLSGQHEDLGQVVHVSLVRELRAGRYSGRGELRSYVSAIAHRNALTELRRQYRDRAWSEPLEHDPEGRSENPYRRIVIEEESGTVHAVLMSLPSSCRELWKLVFADRLDYDAVGARLGVPTGTVKSRMWHCRRKAAEALRRLQLKARYLGRSVGRGLEP